MVSQDIQTALKATLPGSASHRKMLPPNRVLEAAPSDRHKVKQSSVLLILFEENGILKVCLIKRPSHMKHHAGQIALPGGKIEKNENAVQTALRETHEEIGLPEEQLRILGSLSKFYVEVSRFEIQPLVAWHNGTPKYILSPDEVEKIIFFPVSLFKSPFDQIQLETLTGKLDVPCIKYEGEIIWGATAMILSEFSDILQQNGLIVESP